MADMNQSFIRAFAKKEAASSPPASPAASSKRSPRRSSMAASKPSPEAQAPAPMFEAADAATQSVSPLDSLFHTQSVIIGPSYFEEGTDSPSSPTGPWNSELAEAAKAAVSATPRDIGKRSTIPTPPPSLGQPHFEPLRVVQRIDAAHHGPSPLPKIEPVWEVDRLNWPRTCEQLLQEEKAYFDEAAGRLQEAAQQGLRTLAVCGSRRGEGSSTIVLCIARAAAAAGMKVGVLDADSQSNGLSEMLGLEVECDWTRAAASPEAIHENSIQALEPSIVLFLRAAGTKPLKEGISAEAISLIPQVAEQFDLLIIDFGAFADGAFPQAIKAASLPDAALVVRDLRHTSSRAVQATVSRLREAGMEAVGIAENFGAR